MDGRRRAYVCVCVCVCAGPVTGRQLISCSALRAESESERLRLDLSFPVCKPIER